MDFFIIFIFIRLALCVVGGAFFVEFVRFMLCCFFLFVILLDFIIFSSSYVFVGFYNIAIILFIFFLIVGFCFSLCGYVFLMCIFIFFIIVEYLFVRYFWYVLVVVLNVINSRYLKVREDMSKLKCFDIVGVGDSIFRLLGMWDNDCYFRWLFLLMEVFFRVLKLGSVFVGLWVFWE